MSKKTKPYVTRQYMLSSDYEIFHYSNTDLARVSLHHHDFYECYLFISGDVTYLIEGKYYNLNTGDIVLINSRELHQAIINSNDIPYERIVLWINKEFLKTLSTSKTDLTICFEDPNKQTILRGNIEIYKNIKSILTKLLALEEFKGVGSDVLYKAYISEIVVLLNNLSSKTDIKLDIDAKANILIDEVIEYINNNLDKEITLDELSTQFYISKYHLSRKFKQHTGTTIYRYILQKKLILAKELILQSMPIISVYKQCGFGDYSNFFRAFKNEYGVTPKQFYELMNKIS